MIYLFENENNNASVVYDETTLTEEDKARGIAIAALPPEPEPIAGKIAVLKCDKVTGNVWYDYVDIPQDLESKNEQRITELENAILELSQIMEGMI